nr:MAG TPA: upper collar protein [Caudoviricetes sp.]
MIAKKLKTNAQARNNRVYIHNVKRLYKKAISMFEWVNMPEEIDTRYLEKTLVEQGHICFFKDEKLDKFMCLQCTIGGRFNVYDLPTDYHVYTPSGYNRDLDMSNSVVIYSDLAHDNLMPVIYYHAENISNVERTIDINLNQLKRPYVFLVPENKISSVKALFKQIKDNEELIIGSNDLSVEGLSIENTITPNNTIDLYTLKKKYYNEALTDLGISNFSDDKKERLLAGEITSNEEDVYLNRANMLEARKQACKLINEMFGLNIDVKFRYEENETLDEIDETEDLDEVKNNE